MGLMAKRTEDDDEKGGGGSSPWVDLGLRVCPECRRELMGWEERCPADGSEGVAQGQSQGGGIPPVPAHLLDESDPDPASPHPSTVDDRGDIPPASSTVDE